MGDLAGLETPRASGLKKRSKYGRKVIDADRICTTCWVVRDLRTKHCTVSDGCVSEFDHYCGWLGNAIGRDNHRWFISATGNGNCF